MLTLIPKVKDPTSFSDLRPISVCNFSYKIIAKIISNRLNLILPKLVSEEQAGFIKGRPIQEIIALSQELVSDIDKKSRFKRGNLVIKLDMSKAYDRIEWDFLHMVLKKYGFSDQFCTLIQKCTNNNWYSISFMGALQGCFKSISGLRQGDPMFPALFIFTQEVLSRNIKADIQNGLITPYKTTNLEIRVDISMYADDCLLFTNVALLLLVIC